jgi:hypothetical protein
VILTRQYERWLPAAGWITEVAALIASSAKSCAANALQFGSGAAAAVEGMNAVELIKAAVQPSKTIVPCRVILFTEVLPPAGARQIFCAQQGPVALRAPTETRSDLLEKTELSEDDFLAAAR